MKILEAHMFMPKFFPLFILILFSAATSIAQDSIPNPPRQIGVNITGLLSQTPILPSDGQSAGLYALIFKSPSRKKPGRSFRFSVGGKVGGGNFSNAGFVLSIGTERTIMQAGRWQLNFGADGILTFENSAFASGIGLGYGPILGVRFDINKRISLLTEGSAFLMLSAGPGVGLGMNIRPPTGLVLVFKY